MAIVRDPDSLVMRRPVALSLVAGLALAAALASVSAAEARVRGLIQDVSRRDTSALGRDDDLVEAIGMDSLEGLQILAMVEKRFDVRLPDEELVQMRTIGRIADSIEHLRQGGAS